MLGEGAHGSLLQSFIAYFLRLFIGVLIFHGFHFHLWKMMMHNFFQYMSFQILFYFISTGRKIELKNALFFLILVLHASLCCLSFLGRQFHAPFTTWLLLHP